MTATRKRHCIKRTPVVARPKAAGVLYVAFELSWKEWKLAFATGPADNPRLRTTISLFAFFVDHPTGSAIMTPENRH